MPLFCLGSVSLASRSLRVWKGSWGHTDQYMNISHPSKTLSHIFPWSSQEAILSNSSRRRIPSLLLDTGGAAAWCSGGRRRSMDVCLLFTKALKPAFLSSTPPALSPSSGTSEAMILDAVHLGVWGMDHFPYRQTSVFTWLQWVHSITSRLSLFLPLATVLTFWCFVSDILFVLVVLCLFTSFPVILTGLSEPMGSNHHI